MHKAMEKGLDKILRRLHSATKRRSVKAPLSAYPPPILTGLRAAKPWKGVLMNARGPVSLATRSQFVFEANDIITNRFQLCALAAKTSRHLARNLKRQAENINAALRMIASGEESRPEAGSDREQA